MRYLAHTNDFERFLDDLNDAIIQMPEPTVKPDPPRSWQIVGLPRSGSTVLYQLLAQTGLVGYPSNLMASFHRAPWVGAMLQRRLTLQRATSVEKGAGSTTSASLASLAGRTPEPLDPHEFGYFWRRLCGHSRNSLTRDREPTPAAAAQHELDLVAQVFDAPVVYKNFLALSDAEDMRSRWRAPGFIAVKREPTDIAASLLSIRSRLRIPPGRTFGISPEGFVARDDPYDTVAEQVVRLHKVWCNNRFDEQSDTVVVDYNYLTSSPRRVIGMVLDRMGLPTRTADMLANLPDRLNPGAGAGALAAADKQKLDRALQRATANT